MVELIGVDYGHDRDAPSANQVSSTPARNLEDAYPAAATAAVALAQLHSHRPDSDWESEVVRFSFHGRTHDLNLLQLANGRIVFRRSTLRRLTPTVLEYTPQSNSHRYGTISTTIPYRLFNPRDLGIFFHLYFQDPPGRSSTLPPAQRKDKPARPRKSSISQNNRRPKHDRTQSKEHARRLSMEGRKAFSAEPPGAASAMGKRWEDLIEAATSANEADSDRDLTPVRLPCTWLPAFLAFSISNFRFPSPRPSSVPHFRLLLPP